MKKGNEQASEMLNQTTPWEGEESVIKESMNFINKKEVNPPSYYNAYAPIIKTLPDGSVGTPVNIMRYRLKSLGLIDDNGMPLPEDSLSPEQQLLLRKPSPSRTLRVLNGLDTEANKEIFDLYSPFNSDKDLIPYDVELNLSQACRKRAQVHQRCISLDDSYRQLVEIPEDLNNEFVAQVGELPLYLQPNNLSQAAATALIEDILLT